MRGREAPPRPPLSPLPRPFPPGPPCPAPLLVPVPALGPPLPPARQRASRLLSPLPPSLSVSLTPSAMAAAAAEQQQFYLLLGNLLSPDNVVRKQAEVTEFVARTPRPGRRADPVPLRPPRRASLAPPRRRRPGPEGGGRAVHVGGGRQLPAEPGGPSGARSRGNGARSSHTRAAAPGALPPPRWGSRAWGGCGPWGGPWGFPRPFPACSPWDAPHTRAAAWPVTPTSPRPLLAPLCPSPARLFKRVSAPSPSFHFFLFRPLSRLAPSTRSGVAHLPPTCEVTCGACF